MPQRHLGIIVVFRYNLKVAHELQQTFVYIFPRLFHFVANYLECCEAAIYIAPQIISRVHNLEATDNVEEVPNGRQIANCS